LFYPFLSPIFLLSLKAEAPLLTGAVLLLLFCQLIEKVTVKHPENAFKKGFEYLQLNLFIAVISLFPKLISEAYFRSLFPKLIPEAYSRIA